MVRFRLGLAAQWRVRLMGYFAVVKLVVMEQLASITWKLVFYARIYTLPWVFLNNMLLLFEDF